jgi:8-amino-7-oxononanoate synthase
MQPKSFKKLEDRLENNTFRSLSLNEAPIDFYSNDYLGISRKLSTSISNHAGSTGSRLISGNSIEAEACEHFLADFFETESALVFNSGYDANVGLFSCIATRNDTIIYDEYVHASIRDGIRLSIAKSYSFKHNDIAHLKEKLKLAKGDVFLAIESLYSMDGDFAPLEEIIQLQKEFNFYLIVDEAHACGVLGEKGKGLSFAYKDLIFAKIVTFGKAYGTHGAAIFGSQELKKYLINFARSFIYTTALPPAQYQTICEAIKFSEDEKLRASLQEKISLYCENAQKIGIQVNLNSPIQSIENKTIAELNVIYKGFQEAGIAAKIIKSPTVPEGKERIRICLHAFNSKEEITKLLQLIR